MKTQGWNPRTLAFQASVTVLTLLMSPMTASGQESTSPLAGPEEAGRHPVAGDWPEPQYQRGTGRVALQGFALEAAGPATVGFAAAAAVQPQLREGLTLGAPTATRVVTGEPTTSPAGGALRPQGAVEPSELQEMDLEQRTDAAMGGIDPEQAAELARDAPARGTASAAGTTPGQTAAAHAEKWFVNYPLNYEGVPLAKFSDVMTVVAGDGEILYVRKRNMPEGVDATQPTVAPEEAVGVAREDAAQAFGTEGAGLEVSDPSLEIWVGPDQRGHLAWTMTVQTDSPTAPEARQYWVSAVESPEVLYHESMIDHQHSGTVTGTFWMTTPFDATASRPLPNVKVTRSGDGAETLSDADGRYTIPGTGNATIGATLTGPSATIENQAGAGMTRSQSGSHTGAIDLDFGANGDPDLAQVTALFWINTTRDFVRSILSESELEGVRTRVNIDDECNAFWHRIEESINFFRASSPTSPGTKCPNTAYLDVIVHEYGHGLDQMKGGIQDGGYSEGFGDALTLLITRQPCVGRNLFGPGSCLRAATDVNMWPPAASEGVHSRGKRYAQFVWNLAQELAKSRPTDEAYDIAGRLVLAAAAANPADIPDAVRLSFIADDDDGNLTNGTPHFKELAAAADSRNLPRPSDPPTIASASGRIGYAWANDPSSGQYTPSATYAHNGAGGPIEVRRLGAGRYAVRFAGLGGDGQAGGGHVQVTAYGPGGAACKVLGWSSTGADFVANVECLDPAGSPADSRFTVYVVGPERATLAAAAGETRP